MPLQIIHQDITTVECDAIVNPSDSRFSGSGGTDHTIHRAAGRELDELCKTLEPIGFGEIAVTPGFRLPCRYIFHTMGPIWRGGGHSEAMLLRSCYLNALFKARELGLQSIAFPLISSGTFGFPRDRVLRIAKEAIADFLLNLDCEPEIFLCIMNRRAYSIDRERALGLFLYEEEGYSGRPGNRDEERQNDFGKKFMLAESGNVEPWEIAVQALLPDRDDIGCDDMPCAASAPAAPSQMPSLSESLKESVPPMPKAAEKAPKSAHWFKRVEADQPLQPICASEPLEEMNLERWLKTHDDSFAVTLLKLIDRKGMDDVACYKKANVSKNTFSKIKNSADYRPSKATVLAFAIALELTMEETNALLRSAGFSLSHNSTFDLIIEFYIANKMYDIFEINAALYQYDQICLGC